MKKTKSQPQISKGIDPMIGMLWNLITITKLLKSIEEKMDKQIKKVQKDVKKKDMPKAKKDLSKLMKMDKKFDKKIEMCEGKSMKKR